MASRRATAGNDVLLGTIIRIVIWAAIIGLIATPVLRLAIVSLHIGVGLLPIWSSGPSQNVTPAGTAPLDAAEEELYKQMLRLTTFTASPEMAAGAARSLHIVAVVFDNLKPQPRNTTTELDAIVYPDGYRRMTLDVAKANREAVVVVADQPVRWTIAGQKARDWPLVAFEGKAAMDIDTAEPRSIAALRIGAFGASRVLQPVEPGKRGSAAARSFCNAAANWSEFFAVPREKLRFTLVANPTAIAVEPRGLAADGHVERTLNQRQVAKLCDRYWRQR